MRTLQDCLAEAVKGKELSKQEAEYLINRYEGMKSQRQNGGPNGASRQAKEDLKKLLEMEAGEKKRRTRLAMRHIREFERDIASWRDPKGEADIADAIIMKLEHFGEAKYSSVAGRESAIIGMAHAKLEALLHTFRRGALGGDKTRHNKPLMKNLVREARGEDTGDVRAKELFKAWDETTEWLRHRFNAAGGAIERLENWGLPQVHDARALLRAGLAEWKKQIRPVLDIKRMKHPLTGRAINEYELEAVLDDVWESVVRNGWNKRDPSRQAFGRGALAAQRAEHRFLVFKSADDWMTYNEKFGGGHDPFAAMMQHINGMAGDIAALEILGPNPNGTIEWAKQRIDKEATAKAAGKPARFKGKPDRAVDRANRKKLRVDEIFSAIRGSMNTPVDSMVARGGQAVRNYITASSMGGAAISSLTDIGSQTVARKFAAGATNPAGPIGRAVQVIGETIAALRSANRREAVEAGLILDSARHVIDKQARYAGTFSASTWSGYLADRVLTWSGLTPWTQAGRHAFGLFMQNEFAKNSSIAFDALPAALRKTLTRWGFSDVDWDLIRRKVHTDSKGLRQLRPKDIASGGALTSERLAERYLEMLINETEYAVPAGGYRATSFMRGLNGKSGTMWGEAIRSFTQFKTFGVVITMLHTTRMQHISGTAGRAQGAKYAGSLLISLTIWGALAMQLKQIAAGRDPHDMTTHNFWASALLQGGGLGIYGDFLFSNMNRFGGGLATTLTGPAVQRTTDLINLTAGNVAQLASGERTHFGRELVRFVKGNVPGTNIWYMRQAWERMLFDQVQFLVDPDAHKAFRNLVRNRQRDYGQGTFWTPGELLPSRLPDLTGIVGQ